MGADKKIFFASDFHLGLPVANHTPQEREKRINSWLQERLEDAEEIFLLGDIFDFWYEYRHVAPKGHIRFLALLAQLVERGIPVHLLTGNHDVWLFGYLEKELGVKIHQKPISIERYGKRLYLAHGDGLGPKQGAYPMLRWAFHNGTLQRIFSWLHPDIAFWIGQKWSRKSRAGKSIAHQFRGDEEPITQFVRQLHQTNPHDLYIVGHLHIPVIHPFGSGGALVILGDWIVNDTYALWDKETLQLLRFQNGQAAELISSIPFMAESGAR